MLSILDWAARVIAVLFVVGLSIGGFTGKTVKEMRARKDAYHNSDFN
jgi:hypothetical protein